MQGKLDTNKSANILSAKGKIWRLPPANEPTAELLAITDQSPLLAKILLRRGIDTGAKAQAFLSPEHYSPADPHELPDVDKALARINQALAHNEQITIYGDYDVDGITATSLMFTALQKLSAKVSYYIPNRASEGYGLNLKAVSVLASKQQTKLLITCDCGGANFAEINFAKSLGVDTIVLDHHTLPELLPPAKAIVHPKRLADDHPLFHLPGVGVAYKVAEALFIEHGMPSEAESFLDYVTLGMIADLVPLIRENRYLVQLGLPKLIASPRAGIQALLSQIQKSGDTDLVGFGLAPRINAVGRLADAQVAVELLTTSDPELAKQLSLQLQNENTKRQQICEQVLSEAEQVLSAQRDLHRQKAISIYKEGWHHGVVGIVASRLVEKYHRPVFIGELDPQEGIIKGSARGVEGLDLCEVLKANGHLLTKWGGHKMAAGFSLPAEKGEAFSAGITSTCNRMMANTNSAPILNIDLALADMGTDLFACAISMNRLAPFGMENKKPLFTANKLLCDKVSSLGKNGKHHRLDLKDQQTNKSFSCVFWNTNNIIPTAGDSIDIVFTPEINVFNGNERLQLVLSDWQLANDNGHASIALEPSKNAADSVKETTKEISIVNIEAQTQPIGGTSIPQPIIIDATPSAKDISKPSLIDLRHFENARKITSTAVAKLGNNLAIFSEQTNSKQFSETFDRLSLPKRPHLLIQQFPPSLAVWKEIATISGANKIYILGDGDSDSTTVTEFIKRMLGIIRFVVNKKSGVVQATQIAAALGSTDVASALALTLLRKIELIDWYADDGTIYVDLLNTPLEQEIKQLTEYHQLDQILQQVNQFRHWCANASLNELESMLFKVIDHSPEINKQEFSPDNMTNPTINTLEEYAFYQR